MCSEMDYHHGIPSTSREPTSDSDDATRDATATIGQAAATYLAATVLSGYPGRGRTARALESNFVVLTGSTLSANHESSAVSAALRASMYAFYFDLYVLHNFVPACE